MWELTSKKQRALKKTLKRCHRCKIYFITTPSNQKRTNICCPFGCRELQKRHKANQRSKRHYRTRKGLNKKEQLNRERSLIRAGQNTKTDQTSKSNLNSAESHFWGRAVVGYIIRIIHVATGIRTEKTEIELFLNEILMTILRQRSLKKPDG